MVGFETKFQSKGNVGSALGSTVVRSASLVRTTYGIYVSVSVLDLAMIADCSEIGHRGTYVMRHRHSLEKKKGQHSSSFCSHSTWFRLHVGRATRAS